MYQRLDDPRPPRIDRERLALAKRLGERKRRIRLLGGACCALIVTGGLAAVLTAESPARRSARVEMLAPPMTTQPTVATQPSTTGPSPATTVKAAPPPVRPPASTTPAGTSAAGATRNRAAASTLPRPVRSTPPPAPCTSSGQGAFSGSGISFTYPACWGSAEYQEPSSFDTYLVDLAAQAMHDPCQAVSSGASQGTECGWPVDQLDPAGIVLMWGTGGMPGWSLDQSPGTPRTIGGHPAREQISTPGNCTDIHGDESIDVVIQRSSADHTFYFMNACIRGPGDGLMADQVERMLGAVSITGP